MVEFRGIREKRGPENIHFRDYLYSLYITFITFIIVIESGDRIIFITKLSRL
jgi:hypothetical protein